jgi:hypothetical protein
MCSTLTPIITGTTGITRQLHCLHTLTPLPLAMTAIPPHHIRSLLGALPAASGRCYRAVGYMDCGAIVVLLHSFGVNAAEESQTAKSPYLQKTVSPCECLILHLVYTIRRAVTQAVHGGVLALVMLASSWRLPPHVMNTSLPNSNTNTCWAVHC